MRQEGYEQSGQEAGKEEIIKTNFSAVRFHCYFL